MAEDSSETPVSKSPDELALDLTRFIAQTTGYGKGAPTAGFSGKGTGSRSPEEYADSLLELFNRCRSIIRKEPK